MTETFLDRAQYSEEVAMGHAQALRSTLVPKRVSGFSSHIDPSVLTAEESLKTFPISSA